MASYAHQWHSLDLFSSIGLDDDDNDVVSPEDFTFGVTSEWTENDNDGNAAVGSASAGRLSLEPTNSDHIGIGIQDLAPETSTSNAATAAEGDKSGPKQITLHGKHFNRTWFFLLTLGVVSGISAYVIDVVVQYLRHLHRLVGAANLTAGLGYSVALATLAVASVRRIDTRARGSGIPEMKSILSGFELNGCLTSSVAVAKIVGLVAAQGAGLYMGKEGPFVHLSSIYAYELLRLGPFRSIGANAQLKHEILAAACAVGVAVTFGSPIGGVLFSIEVTATHYVVGALWKSLFCSLWGAFVFKVTRGASGIVSLVSTVALPYEWDSEIALFAGVGVLAGFIGAGFVRLVSAAIRFRLECQTIGDGYVATLLVTVLGGLATWPLGEVAAMAPHDRVNDLFAPDDLPSYWGGGDQSGASTMLVAYILIAFFLTAVTIGLPIPCGVFAPVFVMGAAIGRLCGELVQFFSTEEGHVIRAGAYAVVGAAAMGSAVTRSVATAVIVFELIGETSLVVPCLLASIIAVMVASRYSLSIYDELLTARGLPYLFPVSYTGAQQRVFAEDIMDKNVPMLSLVDTTYRQLHDILSSDSEDAYPLVESHTKPILRGIVSRQMAWRVLLRREYEYRTTVLGHNDISAPLFMRQTCANLIRRPPNTARLRVRRVPPIRNTLLQAFPTWLVNIWFSSPREVSVSTERYSLLDSGGIQIRGEEPSLDVSMVEIQHSSSKEAESNCQKVGTADPVLESFLLQQVEFPVNSVDQCPLTVFSKTPYAKLYHMFSMLGANRLFVISQGWLVGVVKKRHLMKHRLDLLNEPMRVV